MDGSLEEARAIIDVIANADIEDGALVGEMTVRLRPGQRSKWLHVAAKEWLEARIKNPECVLECDWECDSDGPWNACSGHTFEFFDDGPAANGFKYCPFCGRMLTEKPFEEDE